MDINFNIYKIIGSPKSSTLEYKAVLPSSKTIAQIISSFANTEGGHIVLGVSDSLEINGLSEDFHADSITKKAIDLLIPTPIIVCQYISFKGKRLYVIGVEKSSTPIRLDENIYIRVGTKTIPSNPIENKELPIVVILTAIKEEYAAVRAHLDSISVLKKDSVLYEEGIFKFNGNEVAKVIIKECGPKNPGTAQETQRAITNFRPQCIFFVGIAGSRKPNDFRVGDVIFPEKVHYYESGKSELDSFKPRPDDVKPTFTLCEIARVERHKEDWKVLIKGNIDINVSADLGVIASGEQVVEHYNSEIGKILSTHYGDTACIAMEEYGFLNAVHRQGVEFASLMAGVVRGVSDILEGSSHNDVPTLENILDRRPTNAKKLAANTAAAFTYWLIVKVFQNSTWQKLRI